jgi:hypothetical protein
MKPIPLVYPESLFKMIWDVILSFVLMYFFVSIPIHVAFNNGLIFRTNLEISMIFICFLLCDYIIKMNTIYYEFGKPVTDRSLIFQRYLKNGFLIDGLSITALMISLLFEYVEASQLINCGLFLFYTQFHYFSKILRD